MPAPKSLEDKFREKNLQRREVSRDGNSFFNAVSGALTNKNTPIQLRERLVEHLMGLQGLYYPRSGVTTMKEYYEIVNNYLLAWMVTSRLILKRFCPRQWHGH